MAWGAGDAPAASAASRAMNWPWKKKPETFAWCGCPDSWTGIGRAAAHDVKEVKEDGVFVGLRYVCHASHQTRFVKYSVWAGTPQGPKEMGPLD